DLEQAADSALGSGATGVHVVWPSPPLVMMEAVDHGTSQKTAGEYQQHHAQQPELKYPPHPAPIRMVMALFAQHQHQGSAEGHSGAHPAVEREEGGAIGHLKASHEPAEQGSQDGPERAEPEAIASSGFK